MTLGQELGLVLPTFAHAVVVKTLQRMWKERCRGRALQLAVFARGLKGEVRRGNLCLKQKIPTMIGGSSCGAGRKGEERSEVMLGSEQPHVCSSWLVSGVGGARSQLCSPLSRLLLLGGRCLIAPWGSCAGVEEHF